MPKNYFRTTIDLISSSDRKNHRNPFKMNNIYDLRLHYRYKTITFKQYEKL